MIFNSFYFDAQCRFWTAFNLATQWREKALLVDLLQPKVHQGCYPWLRKKILKEGSLLCKDYSDPQFWPEQLFPNIFCKHYFATKLHGSFRKQVASYFRRYSSGSIRGISWILASEVKLGRKMRKSFINCLSTQPPWLQKEKLSVLPWSPSTSNSIQHAFHKQQEQSLISPMKNILWYLKQISHFNFRFGWLQLRLFLLLPNTLQRMQLKRKFLNKRWKWLKNTWSQVWYRNHLSE